MYLRRKIDQFLETWKADTDRMPLIVKGTRQVGKTESILHFAKKAYPHLVYINFAEEPKYKQIFSEGYRTEDVVKNITLIDPYKNFMVHQTLIVFDELQECADAATSLKFFKMDGRYDVICSGSMLGIHYKTIESNSVGYKTDYTMRSMDFEEFLWAKGYSESQRVDFLSHMAEEKPFSALAMQQWMQIFLEYAVLGGMPAVVRSYIEKGTFQKSLAMQRQLLLDYEEDVRKYADGLDQARILNVFRHIPVQLAKENKKFQISKVAKGARYRDYRGCIEWMENAGMIHVCRCLSYPELPLAGNYDEPKYKIYTADTGLLVAQLDEEAQEDLRANKNLGVYKGALYENIVAEALVKEGCPLYYYRKENSTLEEDFFLRTRDLLVPVEVKAGNTVSRSLRTLISSKSYPDIQWGIKLARANVGSGDGIYTFPLFCAFLLKDWLKTKN